jgi:hypothetical protein
MTHDEREVASGHLLGVAPSAKGDRARFQTLLRKRKAATRGGYKSSLFDQEIADLATRGTGIRVQPQHAYVFAAAVAKLADRWAKTNFELCPELREVASSELGVDAFAPHTNRIMARLRVLL